MLAPALGHGWSVTYGSLAASFMMLQRATEISGDRLALLPGRHRPDEARARCKGEIHPGSGHLPCGVGHSLLLLDEMPHPMISHAVETWEMHEIFLIGAVILSDASAAINHPSPR